MNVKKKRAGKTSHPIKRAKKTSGKDTCFIIMPFGEWFDYYYETIYIPAIESTGLIPRRADDLYRPSAIVHDIWSLTQEAKVILADLSGKNPNVFYELGLAHSLAKPAILVTVSMDDIPFDLRSLRVILYDKNAPDWGEILGQKIATAIREVVASPLEAVLPTFLKVKESSPEKTVTKTEKELIAMKQDIEMVKRELQAKSDVPSRTYGPPLGTGSAIQFALKLLRQGVSSRSIYGSLEEQGLSRSMSIKMLNSAKEILNREQAGQQVSSSVSEPIGQLVSEQDDGAT